MNPRASVTLTLSEYQQLSSGVPMGGVAMIACATFGIGLVVGMSTMDDPAPAKRQPAVVQPGDAARSIVMPNGAIIVRI